MTLSADRDTQELAFPDAQRHEILATDSKTFYKGGLIGLKAGKLVPGVDGVGDTSVQMIGRGEEAYVTGSGNTKKLKAKSGCFKWANGTSGEAFAAGDIGKIAYVIDGQTVGKSGNSAANAIVGRSYRLDSDGGVWVKSTFPLPQLAPVGGGGATDQGAP